MGFETCLENICRDPAAHHSKLLLPFLNQLLLIKHEKRDFTCVSHINKTVKCCHRLAVQNVQIACSIYSNLRSKMKKTYMLV